MGIPVLDTVVVGNVAMLLVESHCICADRHQSIL